MPSAVAGSLAARAPALLLEGWEAKKGRERGKYLAGAVARTPCPCGMLAGFRCVVPTGLCHVLGSHWWCRAQVLERRVWGPRGAPSRNLRTMGCGEVGWGGAWPQCSGRAASSLTWVETSKSLRWRSRGGKLILAGVGCGLREGQQHWS